MSKLKRISRDYLSFSKKERNVAIYLTTGIILVIFLPAIFTYFPPEKVQMNYSAFEHLHTISANEPLNENLQDQNVNHTNKPNNYAHNFYSNYNNKYPKNENTNAEIKLFDFDPNLIGVDEWMLLGVSQKIAERIINYRSKGGVFKQKEDLLKTYGFSQKDFDRISDFIQIDSTQFLINKTPKKSIINTGNFVTTKINSAIKEDLMSLGFTADNAIRIINFREANGGIYAIEQLYSVFGIDMETLQIASPFLEIDANQIKTMSVNYVTFEQLAKHTYISDDLAKAIIEYRNTTGKFYSISELMKVKGMYPTLYEKLKPYFIL